jgi:hypothetical protein
MDEKDRIISGSCRRRPSGSRTLSQILKSRRCDEHIQDARCAMINLLNAFPNSSIKYDARYNGASGTLFSNCQPAQRARCECADVCVCEKSTSARDAGQGCVIMIMVMRERCKLS